MLELVDPATMRILRVRQATKTATWRKKSRSVMRCGKLAAFPLESNGDDSLSIIGRKSHTVLRRNNRTDQVYSAKSPIGAIVCPGGTNAPRLLSTHNRNGSCHGFQPALGPGVALHSKEEMGPAKLGGADRCDPRKCKKQKKPAPAFPGGLVSSLVIPGFHTPAAMRRRTGRNITNRRTQLGLCRCGATRLELLVTDPELVSAITH